MHTINQLNSALTGRYTVTRELGAGGMATVYLTPRLGNAAGTGSAATLTGGGGAARGWAALAQAYVIRPKFNDRVDFAFDGTKSGLNLAKHGIDFVTAQELWHDDRMLEVQARTTDEPRWLVIGRIGLISVRRARAEEVALYEGEGL